MALKKTEIRRKWQNQEKRSAKKHQGKTRAGSGNKWNAPGDVISGAALISCKRTDAKSISITDSHLKKHIEDAMMENRTPVWEIEVGGNIYYMFLAMDVYVDPETGAFSLNLGRR